ncbi:MAG: hypothetical protein AAGA09_07290 [Pseudomonadota bacterium]
MTSNAAHQSFLDALPGERAIYPHQYNLLDERILLVALDSKTQEDASFLDERVLTAQTKGAWFSVDTVARAMDHAPEALQTNTPDAPRYIFHMGHCGSTLISRLVCAALDIAAVREPLPLRVLAIDAADGASGFLGNAQITERLHLFERLWARGPRPALVKATSMCSGLAIRAGDAGPALFLYQAPPTQLAAMLAGENTVASLRGFAQMRHRRLAAEIDAPPLAGLRLGELAAMAWLAEALAGAAAIEAARAYALNFDDFLRAPAAQLAIICDRFGSTPSTDDIDTVISGPIMHQYSKAPDHPFDATARDQRLAQSSANNSEEIRAGLAWLDALGAREPCVADALNRFSN